MNYVDGIIILVILVFVLIGYSKGLILAFFRVFSFVISSFLTFKIYPYVSDILRKSNSVTGFINGIINEKLNIDILEFGGTKTAEFEMINSLKIPDFIKSPMSENNNVEIYNALGANNVKEYVENFLSNIFVNVLAVIIVFVLVSLAVKILGGVLDLTSKLPIINFANKTGGGIFGLFQGTIVTFFCFSLFMIWFSYSGNVNVLKDMEKGFIGRMFYYNNFIVDMFFKV